MIINNQIFVNADGTDKDIKSTTYDERMTWYNSLSKGQIIRMMEFLLKGNK